MQISVKTSPHQCQVKPAGQVPLMLETEGGDGDEDGELERGGRESRGKFYFVKHISFIFLAIYFILLFC